MEIIKNGDSPNSFRRYSDCAQPERRGGAAYKDPVNLEVSKRCSPTDLHTLILKNWPSLVETVSIVLKVKIL